MKLIPLFQLLIILFFYGCVPISPTSTTPDKMLIYDDINYEPSVGMVKLYPASEGSNASLQYPVFPTKGSGIYLSFDLLEETVSYLNARIMHCNATWEPSILTDIQILDAYNEFSLNQYNYSQNTLTPYVNYYATLPIPKVSGNFILIVYRDGNKDDLLFSRRFSVFEQKTTINSQILQSSIVSKRLENQQIQFTLIHEGLSNINPLREIRPVILQNHNWKTSIEGLQPTLMRPDKNYLEYEHFNGQNNLPGRNEFRYFDLRSIDYRGINVSNIRKQDDRIQAFINQDKSRASLAYTQVNQDINGNYYLENTDPNDGEWQSEYVEVFFTLLSERLNGTVYVSGQFNNWVLDADNQMSYDEELQSYRGKLWLRQGYYDYAYWIASDSLPTYAIEGSFYQTVNNYEILIYYRDPFKNYDELVGYQFISSGN